MDPENHILEKAETYIIDLFEDKLPESYVFHNFQHTYEIVESCGKIVAETGLSADETEILKLAAWFHDAGFTEQYIGHEEASVAIAHKFLTEQNYPESKIKRVEECIKATINPSENMDSLCKLMFDADLLHLGRKTYFEKSKLLRKEKESALGIQLSERDWLKEEIDFLIGHKYYSEYARLRHNERKEKNIAKMREKLMKLTLLKEELSEKLRSVRHLRQNKPSRGIQTMFRTVFRNQMSLSAIADNKANFMLTINSVIISIVVSIVVPRFGEDPKFILPALTILLTSLLTIVFAILSTRPVVTTGKFRREDIENKSANLLFFGNFYKMNQEDYEWALGEVMKDTKFLYGSLTRDLFSLGQVLGHKFRYLRICYNIFMVGLVCSVLVFLVTFLL